MFTLHIYNMHVLYVLRVSQNHMRASAIRKRWGESWRKVNESRREKRKEGKWQEEG